ncbi:hypothetical protein D3C76_1500260 [compost metagenome]
MVVQSTDRTHSHQIQAGINDAADMIGQSGVCIDIDISHISLTPNLTDGFDDKLGLGGGLTFTALPKTDDRFRRF